MLEQRLVVKKKPEVHDRIVIEKEAIPNLKPDEVLIQNAAIGVNFIDIYHRIGLYPLNDPFILGMESAGTVADIGSEVQDLKLGLRVAAVGPVGAYCSHRIVKAKDIILLPDSISFEQAAALLLKGLTVEYLIERCAKVHKGQNILWHAIAGGVGLLACQWLRNKEVTIFGTASNEKKRQLAISSGADYVFDYGDPDLQNAILRNTKNQGCEVIFDGVGKNTFDLSLSLLARRGLLVTFGNASGPVPPISPLQLLKSSYLTRPSLFDYIVDPTELEQAAKQVLSHFSAGVISNTIFAALPLLEIEQAHQLLRSRTTIGSIILTLEK